ncbi:helix-turn-helix transcriptional regulator [Mycobacteroides abscessus]|nr:helix-turn-helix transcriptional regulator [Mycobacteroides abscessus]MDM2558159.1 helix-turn-helix transcriptional regulator [Mycobacteroides abscessus]MDM2563044.1 helix-turn-helix transcriptional regulator [Mycobacteroides abscessus]MDM2578378.1 helix-turn-helix transcriptional regulator [Mycobacteroides abscessus]
MTMPSDWSSQLRAHVAAAVQARRKQLDMSAAALADATDGFITRDTIANLESGRKRVIDIAELIVLAKALDVPPVSLLYPRTDHVEQSPGVVTSGLDATLWFAGYSEDSDMWDVYRYADARAQYDVYKQDPDEAERLSARSLIGQAKRNVRKQGWAVT